ncbi:MAG: hypothetical protein V8T86_11260 [Victivallis sp.]
MVSNPLGNERRARYPEMKKTGQTKSYAERIAGFTPDETRIGVSPAAEPFSPSAANSSATIRTTFFRPALSSMTDSEMEKPAIDAGISTDGSVIHTRGITSDGRMGVAGALARPVRGELALSSEILGRDLLCSHCWS